MENAVRDSIEFTPIMKKAMKPMDSWHVTRREVKRERFRTQFCLARGFNQPLFVSYRAQLALRFQAVSRPLNPCMDAAFCRDRASSPSPNLECGQPLLDSLAAVGGSGPAPVAVDGSEPLRPPDEAPRNTAIRNWGEYAGPPCASRSRKWCVAAFSLSRPWAGIRPRMRLSALRLLTQVPTACPGLGRIDLDASHETILTSTRSGVCT